MWTNIATICTFDVLEVYISVVRISLFIFQDFKSPIKEIYSIYHKCGFKLKENIRLKILVKETKKKKYRGDNETLFYFFMFLILILLLLYFIPFVFFPQNLPFHMHFNYT